MRPKKTHTDIGTIALSLGLKAKNFLGRQSRRRRRNRVHRGVSDSLRWITLWSSSTADTMRPRDACSSFLGIGVWNDGNSGFGGWCAQPDETGKMNARSWGALIVGSVEDSGHQGVHPSSAGALHVPAHIVSLAGLIVITLCLSQHMVPLLHCVRR
jgi:hypothetical protein